jgi:hypothetical protein
MSESNPNWCGLSLDRRLSDPFEQFDRVGWREGERLDLDLGKAREGLAQGVALERGDCLTGGGDGGSAVAVRGGDVCEGDGALGGKPGGIWRVGTCGLEGETCFFASAETQQRDAAAEPGSAKFARHAQRLERGDRFVKGFNGASKGSDAAECIGLLGP